MSEATFTPGPWKVDKLNGHLGENPRFISVSTDYPPGRLNDGGRSVAVMTGCDCGKDWFGHAQNPHNGSSSPRPSCSQHWSCSYRSTKATATTSVNIGQK